MKRIVLALVLAASFAGVKAQNCEVLLLPYFGNDAERMAEYQSSVPDKFAWRCAYARSAFYESDTVPAGAALYNISEVQDRQSGNHLSAQTVIDLSTFSYYAYNFYTFQVSFPTGAQTLCFATPGSAHPYLVLRSLDETNRLATEVWEAERAQ
ncbi:MAG: hypothetical protein J6I49_08785 [Bacteroidales bacterium]|nr:hypothetical protein [Bacteroidales bacterium]